MVGRGFQFDFLPAACSTWGRHSHAVILGLMLAYCTTLSSHIEASSVSCKSENISSKYRHCGSPPDGVHDLDCFGKYNSRGRRSCEWKPGNHASGRTYTLVVQQRTNYCKAYNNIFEFSATIKLYEKRNLTVEVFENGESTNCTTAVFRGSPESLLRCGPPNNVTFSRHSGRLDINVSWQQVDVKAIENYSVRYKALGSLEWNKSPVESQNGRRCTVDNLTSSLVYVAQIQCVRNKKCSQCPWSESYTVPSELTAQPVIINLQDTDIAGKRGRRLISIAWKLHSGYYVTIGKASGEEPRERMNATQPEIRLILSYSDYHLSISAVNNASISPAVNQTIPQREDMPGVGDGRLNVTVHSNASFTIYWKDDLIKTFVCYSVEWRRRHGDTVHMSFYQSGKNYKTFLHIPEPLEPFKRYNITLHTRPNKDPCNMERVNNSESTYGSTQFYFMEGSPVSAPTNISSFNETLKSVVLQWASIPEEDVQGFLLGYIIHYAEYHHSTENNLTVDPASTSCELGDLRSGTAYHVQISGFTSAGAGVRSASILLKTKREGDFNLSAFFKVLAAVVSVLIVLPPIIKRVKVVLWPSIPNPGNSNAMQKIDRPCELELLEAIHTLTVEEWETESLHIIEQDAMIPACTSPSTFPLLHASGDEADSDSPADETTGAFMGSQQSSPFAFPSGYTTMEMFQQGVPQGGPANTFISQAGESKPENTDSTVVKPGLDYIRQFSPSSISGGEIWPQFCDQSWTAKHEEPQHGALNQEP